MKPPFALINFDKRSSQLFNENGRDISELIINIKYEKAVLNDLVYE